jgi:hypothetical protein
LVSDTVAMTSPSKYRILRYGLVRTPARAGTEARTRAARYACGP